MNCYGTYSSNREECLKCELSAYCKDFVLNDRKGDLGLRKSEASIETVAALERFARLPSVYEEPGGRVGFAFHAIAQYLRWITGLSATALRLLRFKMKHPEWQAAQFARAAGITVRTVRAKEKEIQNKMSPLEFMVFIAGPMSGLDDFNRAAFYEAEEQLMNLDFETINPASLTFIIPEYAPHRMFVDTTCALVKHCSAVVRLPGWEKSKGAMRELETAAIHGVPIFDLEQALDGELAKYRRSLP